MTPLTHALVTVAQLLDELGQPERYASVTGYEDGTAAVQIWLDGTSNDVSVITDLAARFDVAVERGGRRFTDVDGTTSHQVSVTTVRDSVAVTFWIREDVAP